MREVKTEGMICVRDAYDFEYALAKIEYTEREDSSYFYEFTPNYAVMDLLPSSIFQGIPGLNLDLRKKHYVRENMVPVFISERTPGENREDLWELLEACGMDYLNRLEWLIRTDLRYSGDPLYVRRYQETDREQTVDFEVIDSRQSRSANMLHDILVEVCHGSNIKSEVFSIDDSNRLQYYYLLMALYQKEKNYIKERRKEGIEHSVKEGRYKGRKPIEIPEPKMEEVFDAFGEGRLTQQQAMEQLGVSRSTFYRRLRQYRQRQNADNIKVKMV